MLKPFSILTKWEINDRFAIKAEYKESLFQAQPQAIQNFFQDQARVITQAIEAGKARLRFAFPEYVMIPLSVEQPVYHKVSLAPRYRRQQVGNLLRAYHGNDLLASLIERFSELQRSNNIALATCADLLRFLVARQLLESLPENADSLDATDYLLSESAARQNTTHNHRSQLRPRLENGDDECATQSPFFLPQWMAFDTNGVLIAPTEQDAKNRIQFMQDYVHRLLMILALDPAITEEDAYQKRFKGMTNQWLHQGQAYARYQTMEIIRTIRERAAQNALNRGLSLSLPYFDDQALELRSYDFEVIPAGRILFEPYFVVQAAEEAKSRVSVERSYSESTKEHLLAELDLIQKSFAFQHHYTPVGLLLQSDGIISSRNQEARRKLTR